MWKILSFFKLGKYLILSIPNMVSEAESSFIENPQLKIRNFKKGNDEYLMPF